MKFAILGAGATGGFLGAHLARAGADVTLIARGPHLAAMRERGITVEEPDGTAFVARPTCTDDLRAVKGADAVFITLKAHSLPAIAADFGAALGESAAVVSCQNGIPWWYAEGLQAVDPGGVVAAAIPRSKVIGCVVYTATNLKAPGVVEHIEGDRFSLGEIDGNRSERVAAIAAALTSAGLRAPIQKDLGSEIWVKLLGNATFNPLSALTGATLATMASDPGSRELIRGLMTEVESVATALGVRMPISIERRIEGAGKVGEHRTSMLQDLESGRPLELDALTGAVIELADRVNVPVPGLRVIDAATRLLAQVREQVRTSS